MATFMNRNIFLWTKTSWKNEITVTKKAFEANPPEFEYQQTMLDQEWKNQNLQENDKDQRF
jgi:hypothetical protein